MIRLSPDEASRILTIEMEGMISEADIDEAVDKLQAAYPQVGVRISGGELGGIGMLLDWRRLQGWAKGAKTLGTLTAKMLSDALLRVAIVGDERWRDEQARMVDVATRAKVRFFTTDQHEQALEWLRGQ